MQKTQKKYQCEQQIQKKYHWLLKVKILFSVKNRIIDNLKMNVKNDILIYAAFLKIISINTVLKFSHSSLVGCHEQVVYYRCPSSPHQRSYVMILLQSWATSNQQ